RGNGRPDAVPRVGRGELRHRDYSLRRRRMDRGRRALHAARHVARRPGSQTSMTHKIAVIAGDGVGKEVIPSGMAAIEAATRKSSASIAFVELPWGSDHYLAH